MSTREVSIPGHAWAATDRGGKRLSPGTCLLLARLHSLAKTPEERQSETLEGLEPEPPFCSHSERALAEDLDCSRKSIRDRCASLSESGWTRRARRVTGGRRVLVWVLAEFARFEHTHTATPTAGSCHKEGNPPAQGIHHHTQGEILPDGEILPCSRRDPAPNTAGSCPKHGGILPSVKGNFDQPPSSSSSSGSGSVLNLDRARIERAIFSLATEHNVGLGLAPGPTALSPAVERVEAGEATLEDIATICAEYSRRKQAGDPAQGYWRNLFYVASWPRTVLEYLRREPAATSTRPRTARRPASALSGADDYWRAKGREGLTSGPVDPGDAETDAEIDAMSAVLAGGDGEF
jgi:hypothetical protein